VKSLDHKPMAAAPRCFAVVAAVSVTTTFGSVSALPADTMAYEWPAIVGSAKVAADVDETVLARGADGHAGVESSVYGKQWICFVSSTMSS
jgi:hypothetical protein